MINGYRGSESLEVDPPAGVELDSFRLEERALKGLGAPVPGARAHFAAGVDHAMPRHVVPIAEGGERVADLSRVPGHPCRRRDRAVGGDSAARDSVDGGVDAGAAGHGHATVG